jgi:hypothetical protein
LSCGEQGVLAVEPRQAGPCWLLSRGERVIEKEFKNRFEKESKSKKN